MKYITLDHIVRSILAQRGLTIHWYVKYLKLAGDCLRELHFDTLRVVNYKLIDIDEKGAGDLPEDYVDWCKVGYGDTQILYPLVSYDGIKKAPNLDENDNEVPYGVLPIGDTSWYSECWEANINIHGEDLGRRFGVRQSSYGQGFKIIRERGIIQLSEAVGLRQVMMEYISDGSSCSAASKIHPYAQKTIEDYGVWKNSRNRDNPRSPEAELFYESHRKLRARLDDFGYDEMVAVIENAKAISK